MDSSQRDELPCCGRLSAASGAAEMSMYSCSSPALLREMRTCGWKLMPPPLTSWLITRDSEFAAVDAQPRNVHGFRRCGICDLNDLLKVFVRLRLARAYLSRKSSSCLSQL